MNVFALSILASPIAGAIAGGRAVDSPGTLPLAAGVLAGLLIGVSVWFATAGFTVMALRVTGVARADEKLNLIQWAAQMAAVLAFIASPLLSWLTSSIVVAVVL